MTTAELLAIPAGRELDRIVSRIVMRFVTDEPLPLSTDIRAAWMVVDQMHLLGHAITLERWTGKPELGEWSAAFILENGHDTGCKVAESAPLAICRAALVAAGMAKT